jgi:hypothetical protein
MCLLLHNICISIYNYLSIYETYGLLGQPAMNLLHSLGDEASGPCGVTQASFVNGALRELRV